MWNEKYHLKENKHYWGGEPTCTRTCIHRSYCLRFPGVRIIMMAAGYYLIYHLLYKFLPNDTLKGGQSNKEHCLKHRCADPRLLRQNEVNTISGRLLLFAHCQDRVHLHDDTPKLSPPEWLYIKTTSCDAYTIRTAITSHLSWLKKLSFWMAYFKLSQFILQRYESFLGVFGICFSRHQHTKEWIKAKVSFDWEICLFLPCRGGIIYFCLTFWKYEFDFKKVGKVSTFWENRNT